MEIWKDVKGYEGLYQVSNLGRVKSLNRMVVFSDEKIHNYKERILKQEKTKINKRGKYYFRVTLSKNNIQKRLQVHQLVCINFIENKENKPCVNHIDGNPENNNLNNLEWCTYSENEKHSFDVLGKINANRKLSNEAIKDIRENYIKGKPGVNLKTRGNRKYFEEKYNVSKRTILNVVNNNYYV